MTLDSKAAALEKATRPDTHTMKTGLETTKPSTGAGIEHLFCPQCRRKNLQRRKGTMTIVRGRETKKVPAEFAVCGYCHITSSIDEVPFSHVLILTESFFPGDKIIQIDEN